MMNTPHKHQMRQLHELRRDANVLKGVLWPMRDALATLIRNDVPYVKAETKVFLNDTLINIKPVKAMARQDAFANLLSDRIDKLRQALRRQVVSREALTALQDALLAVILGIGFVLTVLVWQIPLAEVLVTGVVLNRLISSTSKIQRAYLKAVQYESAFTAAKDAARSKTDA